MDESIESDGRSRRAGASFAVRSTDEAAASDTQSRSCARVGRFRLRFVSEAAGSVAVAQLDKKTASSPLCSPALFKEKRVFSIRAPTPDRPAEDAEAGIEGLRLTLAIGLDSMRCVLPFHLLLARH